MNKKMILVFLIILSIIIIAILSIIIFNSRGSSTNTEKNEVSELDTVYTEATNVDDSTLFFSVKRCINKYIVYAAQKDNGTIYSMLDKEYISKNNITVDSVFEYVKGIEQDDKISIRQMKMLAEGTNSYYYVIGKLLNTETKKYEDFYITVIVNGQDMTFTVIPNQDGFTEGVFKEDSDG